MEKSIAEIIDGFSIMQLKVEKICTPEMLSKMDRYKIALKEIKEKFPQYNWDNVLKIFLEVNNAIWKYEGVVKKAVLKDDLIEVAHNAIIVRELNSVRTALCSLLSLFIGESDEVTTKKDYLASGKE